MIVCWTLLKPETLDNLIDKYITTEMAFCNDEVVDIESLRHKVKKKLKQGECVIEHSQANETTYIVPRDKVVGYVG